MERHDIFPTRMHVKVVLHHLATLFDNTNAVGKPERVDQIVHGILPRGVPRAPNHYGCAKSLREAPIDCGGRRKVPTMSQVPSSIQYICF